MSLTYNTTKARLDFLLLPYRLTLNHIDEYILEVEHTFNQLKYVTEDIHHEVMDDDPPSIEGIQFENNQTLISALYDLEEGNRLFSSLYNPYQTNAEEHRLHYNQLMRNPYLMSHDKNLLDDSSSHSIRHKQSENVTLRDGRVVSADQVQRKYLAKVQRRCEMQLEMGQRKCLKAFKTAYEDCRVKMPPIIEDMLCWPFQLSFVCNVRMLGKLLNLCNAKEIVPDSFGSSYVELVKEEQRIFAAPNSTTFNFTVADIRNLQEVA